MVVNMTTQFQLKYMHATKTGTGLITIICKEKPCKSVRVRYGKLQISHYFDDFANFTPMEMIL